MFGTYSTVTSFSATALTGTRRIQITSEAPRHRSKRILFAMVANKLASAFRVFITDLFHEANGIIDSDISSLVEPVRISHQITYILPNHYSHPSTDGNPIAPANFQSHQKPDIFSHCLANYQL